MTACQLKIRVRYIVEDKLDPKNQVFFLKNKEVKGLKFLIYNQKLLIYL
jgi:hypothetical protein